LTDESARTPRWACGVRGEQQVGSWSFAVERALYLRGRAKHYLELARLITDPEVVSFLRASAARDLDRAVELEEQAKAELERRGDFSESV
jgi:hypothetical protein